MARRTRSQAKLPIESYDHRDKERLNNPPVVLVTPDTDRDSGKKTYAYDPHLDPQLQWSGKAEHTSFEVPTVSLHVHERIDPRTIIEAVRRRNGNGAQAQGSLWDLPEENPPVRDAIDFYKHSHNWTNRLVSGDSLLVMNSLLEKEGMAGKVQMVYIDPPYGIRYGSNFQPFVNKRDVRDGRDEDLTSEPETIKAFRDTWELGIHSYLSYLRDRLLLARELLTESGSCFVQIGEENVHLVRNLIDEVFGEKIFASLVYFLKTTGKGSKFLDSSGDYLLWYAKSSAQCKVRPAYRFRSEQNLEQQYNMASIDNCNYRRLSRQELRTPSLIPTNNRRFMPSSVYSDSGGATTTFAYHYEGKDFQPLRGYFWRTTKSGFDRLSRASRLCVVGNYIRYRMYGDDYPIVRVTNYWDDVRAGGFGEAEVYVVQTTTDVIQRYILLTTDPGDLVLDPTCGSGTTAYVAEQWGRRWVTCDTSRVAVSLTQQRLMTALYEYYELAHPEEGVGSGFSYRTVPHITLRSIANNPEIDVKWQKYEEELSSICKELSSAIGEAEVLEEWEIPREFPSNWPVAAQSLHAEFWNRRIARQKDIDDAITRYAPQETLFDQPLVDTGKRRVTGPFSVEAVLALAVRPLDDAVSGEGEELETVYSGPTTENSADNSIARSGETLRQSDWRDELMKTGIRGKAGQYIRFARLEPLPGCRHLHADGETLPDADGPSSIREGAATSAQRVVVAFGPDHAPFEQKQVSQALEEAHSLVPRPQGHRFRRLPVRPRGRQGHRRNELARHNPSQSADERRPADR